jgi:hypothetical protein
MTLQDTIILKKLAPLHNPNSDQKFNPSQKDRDYITAYWQRNCYVSAIIS